ncbi:MAG TPA: MarR family transcriptional regulator [Actinomycetes bacterium]|nr:MarR family transcriptional regulator [Actinomycetes bacterium]
MTNTTVALTSTGWLDESEQATWRKFLAMTRVVQETLERQLQQDSAMPHTYYLILAMLSEAPERTLRMSELAEIAGTSQSRLSHAAARLEESGWITRRRCATDKRGYLATLTDDGFRVLQATAPGHVEAVRSTLFDPLSAEQVRQLALIADAVTSASALDCSQSGNL